MVRLPSRAEHTRGEQAAGLCCSATPSSASPSVGHTRREQAAGLCCSATPSSASSGGCWLTQLSPGTGARVTCRHGSEGDL